jgi:serine/threonine-protein kinase RsbW
MKIRSFPGRYTSLAEIGEFVRQAASEAGLDSKASYAVETAVDEACSNIIEHAYGGESDSLIKCKYNILPDRLDIILIDHGITFDASRVEEPDLHAGLYDQPGHGLGMFFMRRMMDDIQFRRDPRHGNMLTMSKYRVQGK